MPDLEERFADALHGTARAWRQAVDRRLKSLGLSQASWMTIAVAAKSRTALSQSELADRLGVEGATMVAMVDRLVKAGFVVAPALDHRPARQSRGGHRGRQPAVCRGQDRSGRGAQANYWRHVDPKRLALATDLLEKLQQLIEPRTRRTPARCGRSTGA